MEESQKKGRRGPPPTGKGKLLGVRLQPSMIEMLDEWIKAQPVHMTRQEAIRKLLYPILDKSKKT
jgi:hypothetical protein